MISVGDLLAVLRLRDEMSPALIIARQNISGAEDSLKLLGTTASQAGSALSLGVTAPLVAAAGASLYFAGQFETTMTRVVSLAGVSKDELAGVKQHILDLAPAVGIGPNALAVAMYKVSSTVSDTAVALNILDMAAKGSAAGMGEPVEVAGALTAVINSYGASNITAAHAADVLTKAVQDGGAEAKELAPTLANVVPIAAQLGISFEEVAANIATVTKLGVPASEAVTQLSAVMAATLKPHKEGIDALAKLGMTYADLRKELQTKGLAATLIDLKAQFGDNTEALIHVFSRIEAFRNVLSTTGAQAEIYTEEVKRMKDSTGALELAFGAMQKTQQFGWAQLTASVQVIAIAFGDALAPSFKSVIEASKPVLEFITSAVKWFGELPQPVRTTVIAVLALVAAVGPFLMIFGSMATGLAALLPLISGGAGIVGAFYAWSVATIAEETAMSGLLMMAGPAIIAIAAITAAVVIGYQAWMLYTEHQERAASAQRQATVDTANLARMSKVAGIEFKDMAEAMAWASVHNKQLRSDQEQLALISKATGVVFKDLATATKYVADHTDELQRANLRAAESHGVHAMAAKGLNEQLIAAQLLVSGLTAAQLKDIESGFKMGHAVKEIAAEMNQMYPGLILTEGAINLVKDSFEKNTAAAKKHATELKVSAEAAESAQIATAGYAGVLATLDGGILWVIRDELKHGAAVEDVSKEYGVNKAIVKEVHEQLKLEDDVRKLLTKTTDDHKGALERSNEVLYQQDELLRQGLNPNLTLASYAFTSAGYTVDNFGSSLDFVNAKGKAFLKTLGDTDGMGEQIQKSLAGAFSNIPNLLMQAFTGGGGLTGALKAIGTQISAAILEPLMKGLSTAMKTAVGVGSAAATGIGASAGLGTTASSIVGVTTSLAGAALAAHAATAGMLGFAAGSMGSAVAVGAATMGIGLAVVGIALLIKHYTGLSASVKEARANVVKFQDAFGGVDKMVTAVGAAYHLLGYTADQTNAALKKLWDTNAGAESVAIAMADIADKVAKAEAVTQILDGDFKDALKAGVAFGEQLPPALMASIQKLVDMGVVTGDNLALFNQLKGQTEVDFKKMEDVAKKYGISLDELGPKFQAAKLADTAKGLINDFDTLVRNGADVGAVLQGMGPQINEIVNKSLQFGVAIPANMKPWIEELERTGQLTDENGDKITDLSKLKFADPIVTEFDKVIKKIGDLIDVLTGKLPGAINNLPKPNIPVPTGAGAGAGDAGEAGDKNNPIPMAEGGDFLVSRPTLFLAAETRGSVEKVSFGGAKAGSAGSGNGEPMVIITKTYLDGHQIAEALTKVAV